MARKQGSQKAKRDDGWWARLPGWVSLAAAIFGVLGGMIVVFSAILSIVNWADDTLNWRSKEYETLTSLKAGFDIRYFEDQLGHPVFTLRSPDGSYTESTFRGRDYWAQTISHGGAVEVYAVTSCDGGFQPEFEVPEGSGHVSVVLQRSTLASLGSRYRYYDYVIGANTYHFFDGFYGALPGSYKTFAWGASSTCGSTAVFDEAHREALESGDLRGEVSDLSPAVKAFRDEITANTFVETAPDTTVFDSPGTLDLDLTSYHGFPLSTSTTLWRSVSAEPFPEEP